MEIIIENVRSFTERKIVPLAPLTLLVGENSSGKTTFLAACKIALDAILNGDGVNFNAPPFVLGSFNDIASLRESRQSDFFRVGVRTSATTADRRRLATIGSDAVEATVTFRSADGQPRVAEWSLTWGEYSARRFAERAGAKPFIQLRTPNSECRLVGDRMPWGPSLILLAQTLQFMRMSKQASHFEQLIGPIEGTPPNEEEMAALERMISSVEIAVREGRPYSLAPIRTRPRRTYDPVSDTPTPEGDHVPMVLNRLHGARRNDPRLSRMLDALNAFGKAAGMFERLSVRRMGGEEANYPFQLLVGTPDGANFNLIDVGYGVSQVLPVLVDAIDNPQHMLLLQQPEVHLHPRAQAELGSFLGRLCTERRSRAIVVETHSDYLIDRVRLDIRDRVSLKASDVLILYFSKTGCTTQIFPIKVDESGNLVNAPIGYRQFFLEEERRFLYGQ